MNERSSFDIHLNKYFYEKHVFNHDAFNRDRIAIHMHFIVV